MDKSYCGGSYMYISLFLFVICAMHYYYGAPVRQLICDSRWRKIHRYFRTKNAPVVLDEKISTYSSLTVVCAVEVLSYLFSMVIPRCDYKCSLFMSACLPFSACGGRSACLRAAYSVLAACLSLSRLHAFFLR
jgi:hypothetical protein